MFLTAFCLYDVCCGAIVSDFVLSLFLYVNMSHHATSTWKSRARVFFRFGLTQAGAPGDDHPGGAAGAGRPRYQAYSLKPG